MLYFPFSETTPIGRFQPLAHLPPCQHQKKAPRPHSGLCRCLFAFLFHCQALAGVPAWPFRPRKGAAGHRGAGGRHAPPPWSRPRRRAGRRKRSAQATEGGRRGVLFAPLWGARLRGGGAAKRGNPAGVPRADRHASSARTWRGGCPQADRVLRVLRVLIQF